MRILLQTTLSLTLSLILRRHLHSDTYSTLHVSDLLPAVSTRKEEILFTALLCPRAEPGRHARCLNPIAIIVRPNPG